MQNLEQIKLTRQAIKKIIGIYFLFDDDDLVYVGQSSGHILNRVTSHFLNNVKFNSFTFIEYPPEVLNDMEVDYIIKLRPKYNKSLPTSTKWAKFGTLRHKLGIDRESIQKLIVKHNIQNVNGYYRIKDFIMGND